MEILSTNYNCRNPFVAGFLPAIVQQQEEDVVDGQQLCKYHAASIKKKNIHVVIAASSSGSSQSTSSFRNSLNPQLQTTTIYQIDVSKVCTTTPQLYAPKLQSASLQQQQQLKTSGTRNKKTLRNKRQKEARRKRKNQRHVHFPVEEELIAIVILIEDDECIKESRNKYWELMALDRNRFQHRVEKVAKTLERVLVPTHRDRIYRERFSCDESEEENNNSSKPDSGCDSSTNNDSDQGVDLYKEIENKMNLKTERKKITTRNKRRAENNERNGESGFEHSGNESEDSDSENEDGDENEISLTIALSEATMTTFHVLPSFGGSRSCFEYK